MPPQMWVLGMNWWEALNTAEVHISICMFIYKGKSPFVGYLLLCTRKRKRTLNHQKTFISEEGARFKSAQQYSIIFLVIFHNRPPQSPIFLSSLVGDDGLAHFRELSGFLGSSRCIKEGFMCVLSRFSQLRLTLCDPVDCMPPCSSVHGILQTGVLERFAMPYSRGSSRHRAQTHVSCTSCIAGGFSTTEPQGRPIQEGYRLL